jgi:predicted anti-sigma-YlaC factor YlaD
LTLPPTPLCDRARSWAALAPDGELSELEGTLLRSHLARCGSCSRFAADAASVAEALRTAPLEPLPRPVAIQTWRRRRALARLRTVGAAAAVALMALGIASRAPVTNTGRTPVQPTRVVDFSGAQAELQLLRREQRAAKADVHALRNISARRFGDQPA